MENQHLLDVRVIEPRFKHPFIFNNFDQLLHGEILTIINDHDPLPLFYQLRAERPGIFEWEYVENGPEVWKVNITKVQTLSETVADIVRRKPAAIAIFKKYNIDFCCHGNKPLEEACLDAGLDPAQIKLEINLAKDENPQHVRADEWSLDFLISYIVQNHHSYVRNAIPQIKALLEKVVEVHGKEHPELAEIKSYFTGLTLELSQHMKKEEEILFPVIHELVRFTEKSWNKTSYPFESIEAPILVMEGEHAGAGADLENIRKLTKNFTPPENACQSFRLLFKKLEEFEDDLHQHVHLENNLLFPKALALEAKLR